jgi:hypothetical protein
MKKESNLPSKIFIVVLIIVIAGALIMDYYGI